MCHFLPRNNVECISFVKKFRQNSRGKALKLKKCSFLLCGVQENHQDLKKSSFSQNWISKWISSLQKSFLLKLSPRGIYTLTLNARNAYPLPFSRWNIPKVFWVFNVTWYCCSTSELSWGKGCLRGFSHRSYIGIRKDYWRKVKNIKIQEKCQWAYFIVFAQSFIKTKIICFISSPWVSRNIERKVFLFSRGIRQTENDPLRQRERDSILLSDVPGNIYKSSDPTWEDGSGLNDRNIVQSWGKSASKAWRKGMRKYEPALILHPWGWKHVKTEAVCLIFWSTYL